MIEPTQLKMTMPRKAEVAMIETTMRPVARRTRRRRERRRRARTKVVSLGHGTMLSDYATLGPLQTSSLQNTAISGIHANAVMTFDNTSRMGSGKTWQISRANVQFGRSTGFAMLDGNADLLEVIRKKSPETMVEKSWC